MLFVQDLDNVIMGRTQEVQCDELDIISGYVGPAPVKMLQKLPFKVTVIYGMYGAEGIRDRLHRALLKENKNLSNVDILYSTKPVHSKCYIYKHKGKIVSALIGSANFSTNGLTTPYKEVLADTPYTTFDALDRYFEFVKNASIDCTDAVAKSNPKKVDGIQPDKYNAEICTMPLYTTINGIDCVPEKSGLNWGMAKYSGSHVNENDAYIALPAEIIAKYPQMFPAKQKQPTNIRDVFRIDHRDNDCIEMIWDDGTEMKGLLEGSRISTNDGIKTAYPKQLSSSPHKKVLGEYIRKRIGVPAKRGNYITLEDLDRYGRRTVDISLLGEGIYYMDFSV